MRLLLVEDDDALSHALRQGLAAQGFAVDRASDVREARAAIGLHPYDGMILDLGLPDEDGLALLSELRARADPLPILVVTARGGLSERVQGLNTGADDYLAKPFAFTELLARVRALVRRSGSYVPSTLRVADLELDPGRFSVRRGDVTLKLTAKEFAILEYLMRNAGQLVSRSTLLDQCWDAGYEGLSNLVNVHVGRIRKKLEAAGGPPLLHTVRGAGFKVDARP